MVMLLLNLVKKELQILSDMRTLVEAMEHASKKMHFKEAE